jgi:hypothetical protein
MQKELQKVKNQKELFKVGDKVGYITRGKSTYFGALITSSGIGVVEKILRDTQCNMYKVRENGHSILCTSGQIVKMV